MTTSKARRVLITGGGTFLGINIASALLAEGAEVSLLVREGNEERLGRLAQRASVQVADVWDEASLKGRARGYGTVIHTVGSLVADAGQGFTYEKLNLMSARYIANLCLKDGVSQFVLMSGARAPWVSGKYIQTKREAEQYVQRIGLKTAIIRAPLTYVRGAKRPIFYQMMSGIGQVPPLRWTPLADHMPMPLDVLARGVARIAIQSLNQTRIYTVRDLRALNTADERRGTRDTLMAFQKARMESPQLPFEMLDEGLPFGWMPSDALMDDE